MLNLRLKKAEESPLWSAGHGYKTAQLAQPGMSFRLDEENKPYDLTDENGAALSILDHLEAKGTELMLTHHDVDLTQITRNVLDLSGLAKIRELIGRTDDGVVAAVITEMVANPHNQPGGYRVRVKARRGALGASSPLLNYRSFILETNINTAEEWQRFFAGKTNLPYNAFRNGYAISELKKAVQKYGIPVWIEFRDGYLYPFTRAGDLTMNEDLIMSNKSFMRRKQDKPSTKNGEPAQEIPPGEEIHDIKGIANLTEATDFIALQDQEPRFLKLARDFGLVRPVPGSRDYVGELIQGLKSSDPQVQIRALRDFKQNLGRMGSSANESLRYLADLFRFERPVDIPVLQEAAEVLGEIGQNPVIAEELISWLILALTVEIPAFEPSAADEDDARLRSYLDRVKILNGTAADVVRRIGRAGILALQKALLSANRNSDVKRLRVIMELMVGLDSETLLKRPSSELDKATFEVLVKLPSRNMGLSALARNTLAKIFIPYDLKDWLFHSETLNPEERKLVGEILLELGIEHVFPTSKDSRKFLLEWIDKGDMGMRFLIEEVVKKMDDSNMRVLSDKFVRHHLQSPVPLGQEEAERMLTVLGMMGAFAESDNLRDFIVHFLIELLSGTTETRAPSKNKLFKDIRTTAGEALSWIQSSRSPKVTLEGNVQLPLEKQFGPLLTYQKVRPDVELMHRNMKKITASKELMQQLPLIQYDNELGPQWSGFLNYLFYQFSLDGQRKDAARAQEIVKKMDFAVVPYAVSLLQDSHKPLPLREGAGVVLDILQPPEFVMPPMKAPALSEFDTLTVVSVSRSSIVIKGERNDPKAVYYIKFPVGALQDREAKVTAEWYRKAALRPYLPDIFSVREMDYQDMKLRDVLRLKILDKAKDESELKGIDIEKLASLEEGQTYFLFSAAGDQSLEAWIDASMDQIQKNPDPEALYQLLKDVKQAAHLTAVLHGLNISHGDLSKSILVQSDDKGNRTMKFIDFALSIVLPKFDYLPGGYNVGGGFKGFHYLQQFSDDYVAMIAMFISNATGAKGEPQWSIRKKLDILSLLDQVARVAARLPQDHDMYTKFKKLANDNMSRLADHYFSKENGKPDALEFLTAKGVEAFLDQEIRALKQQTGLPERSELRLARQEPSTAQDVGPFAPRSELRTSVSHDVREEIIAKLKRILGEDKYQLYQSGFSSIDIVRQGISKSSSMKDYSKRHQLEWAVYFGDEFYDSGNKKGNDMPLLEASAEMDRQGRKLILISTDQDPDNRTEEAKEKTIWIGAGSEATKEVLRLIKEGLENGKDEIMIPGKGPDKDKTVRLPLGRLAAEGALVFDSDGTILDKKEEDFSNQPEIRSLFAYLLHKAVRLAIITGNSRALQKERIGDALSAAPELRDRALMAGFEMYVHGGATLMTYDAAGQEQVRHLSEEISDADIRNITVFLEQESKSNFGLDQEEMKAWKAFFRFDGQYGTRPDFPGVRFDPWWNKENFTPAVVTAESVKNAGPSNPLLLTEPYVEVRDRVQSSLKVFPRSLTPEGNKPQPPRSELRVKVEIPGEDPGRPILLEIPESLAADLEKIFSSWKAASPEKLWRLRKMEMIDQFEWDPLLFWALENYAQIVHTAMDVEKDRLKKTILYRLTEDTADHLHSFKVTTKNNDGLTAWWYWVIRLMSLQDPWKKAASDPSIREHIDLIDNFFKTMLAWFGNVYDQGNMNIVPKEAFEDFVINSGLLQKHPELSRPVSAILTQWEKWTEEGRRLARIYAEELLLDDDETYEDNFVKKLIEEQENSQKLYDKMSLLENALAPVSEAEQYAWTQPVDFLVRAAEDAKIVFLKNAIKIESFHEFPKSWEFQLNWLREMGNHNFRSWGIMSKGYIRDLYSWLLDHHDKRGMKGLVNELQEYLDAENAPPIRRWLMLPQVDETPEVTESLKFWERLWQEKNVAHSKVTLFLNTLSKDDKNLTNWVKERKDLKHVILFSHNSDIDGDEELNENNSAELKELA
ncbi:MAG TPA: hypothetical protein VD913_03335, partial [bacterium]|nr:hypothetical protein [bacterium]